MIHAFARHGSFYKCDSLSMCSPFSVWKFYEGVVKYLSCLDLLSWLRTMLLVRDLGTNVDAYALFHKLDETMLDVMLDLELLLD